MESRRAETLEALSAYLQHQKTLLARTQADIERLRKLRAETLAPPGQSAKRSNSQESDTWTSRLLRAEETISDLQDYHPAGSFPAKIDWEVFASSDATPLRTLAIRTRIDHTQRSVPSNTQRSPLSLLQKFVKDARKVILDPVFETLSSSADMVAFSNPPVAPNYVNSSSNDPNHTPSLTLPSSLTEDENEAHQQVPVAQESMTALRKRERGMIRDLKKRKIKTDLVVGCKLGEEGSSGIPLRHDIENVDVDLNMETSQSCLSAPVDGLVGQGSDHRGVDSTGSATLADVMIDAKLLISPRTCQTAVPRQDNAHHRSPRTRKPSLKLQTRSLTAQTECKNDLLPPSLLPMSSQSLGKRCRDVADIDYGIRKPKTEPLSVSEMNAEMDRNKSETYKQAWSISEQHLLERLLEEIPEGERNRWAKISQAMGGRRTPRQVASRVQKYLEKLKRFGVGIDSKGKAKS